jgi:hypothetical protein
MNASAARCDVCGDEARARSWLPCMNCGRRFHFASMDDPLGRDCGMIVPNPLSEDGC